MLRPNLIGFALPAREGHAHSPYPKTQASVCTLVSPAPPMCLKVYKLRELLCRVATLLVKLQVQSPLDGDKIT